MASSCDTVLKTDGNQILPEAAWKTLKSTVSLLSVSYFSHFPSMMEMHLIEDDSLQITSLTCDLMH